MDRVNHFLSRLREIWDLGISENIFRGVEELIQRAVLRESLPILSSVDVRVVDGGYLSADCDEVNDSSYDLLFARGVCAGHVETGNGGNVEGEETAEDGTVCETGETGESLRTWFGRV